MRKDYELEWIKGSVPVPDGKIDITFEETEDGLRLWIDGPDKIEYVVVDKIKNIQCQGRLRITRGNFCE